MKNPAVRPKFYQIAILLVSLFFILFGQDIPWAQTNTSFPVSSLSIISKGKTHRFTIEVATSNEQLSRGLMYRTSLEADHGMLFIFPSPQPVSMWMKNTHLPLDMLFIDEKGHIISIAENTKPESTEIIRLELPTKAVLELAGGQSNKRGIGIGDVVSHAAFAK